MRIGTWNVENRLMTDKHRELLLDQKCDVWLLTELNRKWFGDQENKIFHFNCHLSSGVMGRMQHWAAVLSVSPLEPKVDPHEASASASSMASRFVRQYFHGAGLNPIHLPGKV